jgi:DNA-binding beta-propeller fold protein YncE
MLLSFLLLVLACSDSTGPSFVQYSQVSVINTSTGSIVTDIELNTLNRDICVTPDGRYAYVASYYADHVIQIDCLSYSVSSLDLGSSKHCLDLCLNDQGTELYAISLDELFVVDIPSMTITDTVGVNMPLGMDVSHRPGTDLVYVSIYYPLQGTLVIDVEQGEVVDTLSHASPMNPVFSETGNELYFSNGTLLICLDPDTGDEIVSEDLGNEISDICLVPGSNTMYASWWVFPGLSEGGVLALDRNTLAVTNSLDLASRPTRLCHVPVLDLLYVGTCDVTYDERITVVDLPGLNPAGEIEIAPGIVGMAPGPSGNFVYCSIYFDNESG